MGTRFERIEGTQELLRESLAFILAHLPMDAEIGPEMSPAVLAAIGIEAADVLDFALPIGEGLARVQLLITPYLGLQINLLAASAERDTLTEDERVDLVGRLLAECIIPAFEAHPGTALVVVEGDERKTLRHRSSPT